MKKEKYGKIKDVTSLTNPLIKTLKSLHLKKYREEQNLFLAEGVKLIIDALERNWPISMLVIAKDNIAQPLYEELIMKTLQQGGTVLFTSKKILANLSKRENPQMAIASFERRFFDIKTLKPYKNKIYLALDRIRDPGNLGTILRTADAAGIDGIFLVDSCTDVYALETVRATMGSIFAMPIYLVETGTFIEWQKAHSVFTVGTHLKGAVDYRDPNYIEITRKHPLCLLMGNEQQGLSETLSASCDQLVFIPQTGQADSLNLSIASALMIYEAKRHIL